MPQSILSNTVVATVGRVMNVGLGLVVVGLITRYLGPASYGHYVLLLSFGSIIQLIADAGLYLTLSRWLASGSAHLQQLVADTISLRTGLLFGAFLVGTIIVLAIPSFNGLVLPFLVIALGLAMQSISQLYMSVYQHQQTVWRATLGDLLGRFAQIIGIVLIGLSVPTLTEIAVMFAVGSAVTLGLHWLLSPSKSLSLSSSTVRTWRELLSVSWPLGAMLVLNAIYFRVDTVILSLWRTSTEVAWYGLAYRIIESALFFPAMFGGLLLPRLSEAIAHADTQRAAKYLVEGLRVVLVVAGAALAIVLVENEAIVTAIAGEDFRAAGPLLSLLGWALLIMYLGNLFGFTLVALARQRALLVLYAVLAVINLVANIALIPTWGAVAAASTTIVTELIAMTVAGVITWRALRFTLSPLVLLHLSGVFGLGVLLLTVLPMAWPLLVRLLVFSVAYAALAWSSGLLVPAELLLLTSRLPPKGIIHT